MLEYKEKNEARWQQTYVREFEDGIGLLGDIRAPTFLRDLCELGANEVILVTSVGANAFDKILQRLLEQQTVDAIEHVEREVERNGERRWGHHLRDSS